jgi:hypothetical protein
MPEAMKRLPDPDPALGGESMPEAVFEHLLADSETRNGTAYQAIVDAEAAW